MTIPILSKHARSLGSSPTVAGLLSSVYGLLQLLSSPLVGRWSDISGRKFVLVCCLCLSSIGYFFLGFSSTCLYLFLARIPAGLFKHSQELSRAYLADITPVHDHSRVFGQFNSISSIGFIIGPIVGGHLADSDNGFFLVSFITAVIFFIDMLLVYVFLPGDVSSANLNLPNARKHFEEFHPLAFLRSFNEVDWKNVWDIFLVRFLFSFAVLIFRSDFATTLSYKYEASSKLIGYVIAYSGIVGTISGFFVGRIASKYSDEKKLLLHTGIVQMMTLGAMTFAPNIFVLALLMTPLSISNTIARICAINLTLARGKNKQKGVLMGLGASVLSLSRMTAPAIGGLSLELSTTGPNVLGTFVSAAGIFVMLAVPNDTKRSSNRNSDDNKNHSD